MSLVFSAIALPELNLNLEQSSWFASLSAVSSVLGNLLTGYVIDRYGRKKAFLVNTIPAFVGFLFLAVAGSSEVAYLYTGQLCAGVSQGAAIYAGNVYIAESLAPDNLRFRSSLASWNVLSSVFGSTMTYVLGYFVLYKTVALLAASIALISSILVLVFIPESPAWLDQQGRFEEAQQARNRLGSVHKSANYMPIGDKVNSRDDFYSYLLKIARRDVHKPLLIAVTYFLIHQFSGTMVFTAYMVDIITVKSLPINSYLTTLICGIIMSLGQISYTVFLPKLGVKRIAILSSLLTSLATLVLAICIHLNDTVTGYSHIIGYIHIVSVWCIVFFSTLGINTVPYTILGEIFPTDAKGFASVSVFSDNMFYFINLMMYPRAVVLSSYGIFYAYAMVGFLAVPFVYYCVPETVGRSLEEICCDFTS
ncbi:facilitated trehalose transporter Tret1-like [Planococcus citri]|uniref:facilitated trehalose transporter Tret1-like n=1 Tax=Planococcus citri TaxID=170843 RepID=UPI0031F867C7